MAYAKNMLIFFWSSIKVYIVYGFMEPISKALKLLKLFLWILLLILKMLKIMAQPELGSLDLQKIHTILVRRVECKILLYAVAQSFESFSVVNLCVL